MRKQNISTRFWPANAEERVILDAITHDDENKMKILTASGMVGVRTAVAEYPIMWVALELAAQRTLRVLTEHLRPTLHQFMIRDDPKLIRFAESLGVDLITPDPHGSSPLHHAIRNRFPRIARYLLDAGVPHDICDDRGETPLLTCILARDAVTLRRILHLGKVNPKSAFVIPPKSHALQVATEVEDPALVRLLLPVCDVNAADRDGWTALHSASRGRDARIAGLLIRAGADVNAVNWVQSTPLHFAAGHNLMVTKLLLRAGADVNALNEGDDSPLHFALLPPGVHWRKVGMTSEQRATDHMKIAEVLLRAGADPNLKNVHGLTPSMKAPQFGPAMIRLFKRFGGEVNPGSRA